MNIFHRLTLRSMVKNRTRTIVTAVGVALSAALFCGVATLGASVHSYLVELQLRTVGDYHVSCTRRTPEEAAGIRESGAASVAEAQTLGMVNPYGQELGLNSGLVTACSGAYFAAMPKPVLKEGRLPGRSGEIAIGEYLVHVFEGRGYAAAVGSTVTLPVTPYVREAEAGDPNGAPFTVTGTIVGIIALDENPQPGAMERSPILLYRDTPDPNALYSDLYLKAVSPYRAEALAKAVSGRLNYGLLRYYGVAGGEKMTLLVLTLCLLVGAIILAGAVSLISNAFSISVSQRIREFGLLASVGATRRQLRSSVRFEAGALCLLGIPVGLALGYTAVALMLGRMGRTLESILVAQATGLSLRAAARPAAILGAALISAAAVYLSARRPARRATRIPPLAAIRQEQEGPGPDRGRRIAEKLWLRSVPRAMAKKYFRAGRKKYRSTAVCLGISVVLFFTAVSASAGIRSYGSAVSNTESFDFIFYSPGGDLAVLERIAGREGVSKTAFITADGFTPLIPEEDYSARRQEAFRRMAAACGEPEIKTDQAQVYYLEDAVLKEFLLGQKLDPALYLDAGEPLALVCYQHMPMTLMDPEGGAPEEAFQAFPPLAQETGQVHLAQLDDSGLAEYFRSLLPECDDFLWSASYAPGETGLLYRVEVTPVTFVGEPEQEMPGEALLGEPQTHTFLVRETGERALFYPYDEKMGLAGEAPAAEGTVNALDLNIGAQVDALPFGISRSAMSYSELSFILPLSAAPESALEDGTLSMALKTDDYLGFSAWVEAQGFSSIAYQDLVREEYRIRQVKGMIDAFAYAFVAILTAVSAANAFNIISTDILLRRRDFGMLRSLGMSRRALRRMVEAESLQLGLRVLGWSMPAGLAIALLATWAVRAAVLPGHPFPWGAVPAAVGGVFLVVLGSMLYSLHKIKNDTPLTAIRMENL